MWITSQTTGVSAWSLNQFYEGDAFTYDDMPKGGEDGQSVSSVRFYGDPLIYVSDSCNALTLIVLFMGFILAYPGDWRYKLLFIPLGTVAIFFINVIRVQVLILNYMYFTEAFDFNHKYTFTIAVYLVVFWFWMLWANKFSKKKFNLAKRAVA
jgi:exosortase family protein XrtF